MSHLYSAICTIGAVGLSGIGVVHLTLTFVGRKSPAETRGSILAAATCLLAGAAMAAEASRIHTVAILAAPLGALSAVIWFRHIYAQSLHNTTM